MCVCLHVSLKYPSCRACALFAFAARTPNAKRFSSHEQQQPQLGRQAHKCESFVCVFKVNDAPGNECTTTCAWCVFVDKRPASRRTRQSASLNEPKKYAINQRLVTHSLLGAFSHYSQLRRVYNWTCAPRTESSSTAGLYGRLPFGLRSLTSVGMRQFENGIRWPVRSFSVAGGRQPLAGFGFCGVKVLTMVTTMHSTNHSAANKLSCADN